MKISRHFFAKLNHTISVCRLVGGLEGEELLLVECGRTKAPVTNGCGVAVVCTECLVGRGRNDKWRTLRILVELPVVSCKLFL